MDYDVTLIVCCSGVVYYLLFLFLGRFFDRVDLIKPVSNVRPYVRAYIRPSVHKSFFNFSKIWHVGRGRRVMHDGMQYDPIQSQGHEPFKVGSLVVFKGYLFPIYNGSWQLTTGS